MGNRQVQSTLTPGRVVLLQQPGSGLSDLALVLGSPDTLDQLLAASNAGGGFGGGGPKKGLLLSSAAGQAAGSGSGGVGPERVLWFLVLHHPSPLDPPAADAAASAAAAAQIGAFSAAHARALHAAQLACACTRAADGESRQPKARVSSKHCHLSLRAVLRRVLSRCLHAEEEFAGFVLKGGGGRASAAASVPGPLPRYGTSAGIPYMITAAPAKQVRARVLFAQLRMACRLRVAHQCSHACAAGSSCSFLHACPALAGSPAPITTCCALHHLLRPRWSASARRA